MPEIARKRHDLCGWSAKSAGDIFLIGRGATLAAGRSICRLHSAFGN